MTIEELIYTWENQLVLYNVALKSAMTFRPHDVTLIRGAIDQLNKCLSDLKQLNGEVRQAPLSESKD